MSLYINKKYLFIIFCIILSILILPNIVFAFTNISANMTSFSHALMALGQSIYLITIKFSILNFSTVVKFPIVEELWQLFRDLVNIVIIVLFIWTAFTTVIEHAFDFQKKMLFWLIIASILNNFSAFFVSALVDVANAIVLIIVNLSLNAEFNFVGDLSEKITKAATAKATFLYFWTALLHLCFAILFCVTYLVLSFFLLSRFVSALLLIITSPFGLLGFLIKPAINEQKNTLNNILNDWHERWFGMLTSVFLIPIIGIFTLFISTSLSRSLISNFGEIAKASRWEGFWLDLVPILVAGIIFFIINSKAWKIMFSQEMSFNKKALGRATSTAAFGARNVLRGARGVKRRFSLEREGRDALKENKRERGGRVGNLVNSFIDRGREGTAEKEKEIIQRSLKKKREDREKDKVEQTRVKNLTPEEREAEKMKKKLEKSRDDWYKKQENK